MPKESINTVICAIPQSLELRRCRRAASMARSKISIQALGLSSRSATYSNLVDSDPSPHILLPLVHGPCISSNGACVSTPFSRRSAVAALTLPRLCENTPNLGEMGLAVVAIVSKLLIGSHGNIDGYSLLVTEWSHLLPLLRQRPHLGLPSLIGQIFPACPSSPHFRRC